MITGEKAELQLGLLVNFNSVILRDSIRRVILSRTLGHYWAIRFWTRSWEQPRPISLQPNGGETALASKSTRPITK
jgi:hypothetical protein